jgi:hypothetical protein
MRQVAVDTAKFVQKLVLSQVPEKQARAHVEVSLDIMKMNLDGLATQIDIHRLETKLEAKIDKQAQTTQVEMQRLESKIDQQRLATQIDIQRLESKIDTQGQTTQTEIKRMESLLELKIGDVRHEIKEIESRLNLKIEKECTKLDGKFTLLCWILGFLLTGVGSLIAALAPFAFKLLL